MSHNIHHLVDAKVSVFHEYGKVIFSLLLLAGGIIMNALDLAFFREGYVSLIWYIVAYLPVGIPVMKETFASTFFSAAHE